MSFQIASVCFGGFPGTNRHLREVSRASGLTRHLVLTTSDPASPEILFQRDYLMSGGFRLIVFGGWHPVYESLVDTVVEGGAEVGVLWTSSAAQTGLSGETGSLTRLLSDPRIGRFFATSPEMVGPLAASGRPSAALPLAFTLPEAVPPRRETSGPPVVSLFSAPQEYARKNLLSCLFGLASQDVPYELHLNGLSEDASYRAYLDIAEIPYREWGWMTDEGYARALDGIDLGIQVSLADAFNYVAAEHFARGVPVLVSRSVPCARGLSDEARGWLVVDDPDDPLEIGAKIRRLLASPADRRALGRVAREHIETISARNRGAAITALHDALAASRAPRTAGR